ncbi:MAG TPA: hypothetical protein VJ741_19215 [Solirubrobacteraceae bacterium]|nr:hypothetical protein [Solirubrobacteraceae bacterium]
MAGAAATAADASRGRGDADLRVVLLGLRRYAGSVAILDRGEVIVGAFFGRRSAALAGARRRGRGLAVAGLCGGLLAAPVVLPAQARAACGVRAPDVGWQLAVHLSHRYCLTLTPADASPTGGGQLLIVQTTKGTLRSGLTRVEYRPRSVSWSDQWSSLARARSDNRVSMDLGALGSVAVRFYPRRTVPLPPSGGCPGQDGRQLLGVWKGTITFTGEHRYATVRTHEAPGTVILKPASATDPNCGQPTTVAPTDIPGPFGDSTLTLEVAHGTGLFDAYLVEGASTVEFKAQATLNAHESGCSVERLAPASDFIPSSDLDWNASTPPSSATLTPPAPFTGVGHYANRTLTGTISFFCPNVQRYVPLPSPAPASPSFFP